MLNLRCFSFKIIPYAMMNNFKSLLFFTLPLVLIFTEKEKYVFREVMAIIVVWWW